MCCPDILSDFSVSQNIRRAFHMNAVHVTPSVRLICRARRGSAGSAGSVLGVPELVEHLGGMDHGLRRNAPDVEAHAADDSRSMMAVFTLSWPSRIAAK